MSWISDMLIRILAAVNSMKANVGHVIDQNEAIKEQNRAILEKEDENSIKLDKLLELLTPPPPVAFEVEVFSLGTGENPMAKLAKFGKMKITVLDNGTAKAVATAVDSVGIATTLPAGSTTPAWTASDAGVVINPDPTDPSGLTAIFGPATPPALVAAFTVSVDAVLPDGTTHIDGTSESNSIIAGGPAGFTVATSAS